MVGLLSFSIISEERAWSTEIIDDLHLIAQCFAHALARKLDDLALRRTRERLSLAADATGVALWSIENRSERLRVSDSGREQFGLPPGELTLKRFLRLVHPEDRAAVEAVYRSCTDGAPVEVEYRLVESDASVRWLYSRVRQQFDSAGRPTQVMGITLDVTKQKEMARRQEEQLHEISRLKKRLEAEVDEVEAAHIRRMLRATGWRIEGKAGAAALLGLNPSTLRGRIRKLGIRRNAD